MFLLQLRNHSFDTTRSVFDNVLALFEGGQRNWSSTLVFLHPFASTWSILFKETREKTIFAGGKNDLLALQRRVSCSLSGFRRDRLPNKMGEAPHQNEIKFLSITNKKLTRQFGQTK